MPPRRPFYKRYFHAAHINDPIPDRTERRNRNQLPQQNENENVNIILFYVIFLKTRLGYEIYSFMKTMNKKT